MNTKKEGGDTSTRVFLHLPPTIAPVQVAVLPLSKKLSDQARQVFEKVRKTFRAEFDENKSIGKRYRRQDEIGTPYCVCVDFDSKEDESVTIRDRDTMDQERVKISEIQGYIFNKINT